MPVLDDALVEEIFRGMSGESSVPSKKLFEALAKANGSKAPLLEDLYRKIYRDETGEEDDPLGPLDFDRG